MFSAQKAERQVHVLKVPQERSDEEIEAVPTESVRLKRKSTSFTSLFISKKVGKLEIHRVCLQFEMTPYEVIFYFFIALQSLLVRFCLQEVDLLDLLLLS